MQFKTRLHPDGLRDWAASLIYTGFFIVIFGAPFVILAVIAVAFHDAQLSGSISTLSFLYCLLLVAWSGYGAATHVSLISLEGDALTLRRKYGYPKSIPLNQLRDIRRLSGLEYAFTTFGMLIREPFAFARSAHGLSVFGCYRLDTVDSITLFHPENIADFETMLVGIGKRDAVLYSSQPPSDSQTRNVTHAVKIRDRVISIVLIILTWTVCIWLHHVLDDFYHLFDNASVMLPFSTRLVMMMYAHHFLYILSIIGSVLIISLDMGFIHIDKWQFFFAYVFSWACIFVLILHGLTVPMIPHRTHVTRGDTLPNNYYYSRYINGHLIS